MRVGLVLNRTVAGTPGAADWILRMGGVKRAMQVGLRVLALWTQGWTAVVLLVISRVEQVGTSVAQGAMTVVGISAVTGAAVREVLAVALMVAVPMVALVVTAAPDPAPFATKIWVPV